MITVKCRATSWGLGPFDQKLSLRWGSAAWLTVGERANHVHPTNPKNPSSDNMEPA
jgi:hypothetical protein